MPRKALKPCKHPGCPNLTAGLYCAKHQPLHPDRPSAAKRGYGSRWQRLSKACLRRHNLCVRCKAQGRFTAATVVDHIIPHRGDPHLMWDESNWQALCKVLPRPQDMDGRPKSRLSVLIVSEMLPVGG